MMRAWGRDLETGYGEIDREHRNMLSMAHALVNAAHNGTPHAECLRLMELLVDYVARHHDTEEGLMATFHYPDMEKHIEEHRDARAVLDKVHSRFAKNPHSMLVTLVLRGVVRQWISHHIKTADMELVAYLLSQPDVREG